MLMNNDTFDATELTLKILSCMYRAQERYGSYLIASVLCGKTNKKVKEFGLEKLSTFGIVHDLSINQVVAVITYLRHEGFIYRSTEHNSLKIALKGKQFLKNKPTLILSQKILDDAKEPLFAPKLLPTHFETFSFWQQHKSIFEIAKARNLTESTIEGHIADLVYHGEIEGVGQLIPDEKAKLIKNIIIKNSTASLKEIKIQLPEDISYGQIKIILASEHKNK